MVLPCASVNRYHELVRKLVPEFTASRHMTMSTIILFNIRQGPSESSRDYLALFNEATIKVFPPNQEMFVCAPKNGLKMGHFNESVSQKLTLTLAEVVTREEFYIKDEESNAEK